MKKIVNQPKGLRLDGVVDNEGVGFIPTKEAGPASVQTSGFFATADENGNINCDVIYPDYRSPEEDEEYNAHDKMDNKIHSLGKLVLGCGAAIIVACFATLFLLISSPNVDIWLNVLMTIVYMSFVVIIIPKAFAIFVGKVFRNKEMVEFSKYLGAKNAVQNAYYDLGKTTAEEWQVAKDAFNYDGLMKNGNWGLIHEINHHYQRRYSGYSDEWGLGDDFTEITNVNL